MYGPITTCAGGHPLTRSRSEGCPLLSQPSPPLLLSELALTSRTRHGGGRSLGPDNVVAQTDGCLFWEQELTRQHAHTHTRTHTAIQQFELLSKLK